LHYSHHLPIVSIEEEQIYGKAGRKSGRDHGSHHGHGAGNGETVRERRRACLHHGPQADLDRLFETVKRDKGQIDVLFASAGVGWWVPLHEVTEKHYADTFDVNVKGTLFTMVKALPLLKDGASVILNGSVAGSIGGPAFSVYSASKAAVRSFARNWILDLKPRKIRVNVLSPGPIDTASLAPLSQEQLDGLIGMTVLGRLGKPAEIASAALFLASDDSSYITGTELFVDGGLAQV
jgi:NAD(P)-dependent dehydrogenase (short-subunit alcohol dehydrogenase family)